MATPRSASSRSPPTGIVEPWMVFLAVFAMGSVNAVDNPARQSFVMEMVGPGRVVNAVDLNSVIVQMARIVGPALAGLLIAGFGVVPCFALNALTSVAMIVALWGMDPKGLHTEPVAPREPGAIRAGLRYVAGHSGAGGAVGADGAGRHARLQLQVVLPLLAKFSFDGNATTYALMVSAMAVGSIAGALVTGAPRPHRSTVDRRRGARLRGAWVGTPRRCRAWPWRSSPWPSLGAAAVPFAATINSTLQLAVAPAMRGRVMALLLGRLPRLDPDRRPPHRLARRNLRSPRGAPPGRHHRPLGGLGSPHQLRPHQTPHHRAPKHRRTHCLARGSRADPPPAAPTQTTAPPPHLRQATRSGPVRLTRGGGECPARGTRRTLHSLSPPEFPLARSALPNV